MKSLLVFAAALGVPLCALAQPAADDGKATGLPGVTVTPKSTDLSGITVTGKRCTVVPPDEHHDPREWDAPATKVQRTEPKAGTVEFLEKAIAMFARQTTFDQATAPKMGIALSRATEAQFGVLSSWVKCRGAPKSIRFLHVSDLGYDDYEVDFENGAIEWEVEPPRADQAVYQTDFRYFYPQPATRKFEALLKSMERGRPNAADLTPDLAATVQAQGSALRKQFKDWGGLESVYFVRHGDDGADLYVVGFAHRKVVWEVAPLDANGKLTGLKYAEAAG